MILKTWLQVSSTAAHGFCGCRQDNMMPCAAMALGMIWDPEKWPSGKQIWSHVASEKPFRRHGWSKDTFAAHHCPSKFTLYPEIVSLTESFIHFLSRRGDAFNCSILNEVFQNCHSAPKQTILRDLPYKNPEFFQRKWGYLQFQKFCKDWISSTSIYNLKVLLDLALFDLHCYTVSWQLWLWQPSKFTGGFINKNIASKQLWESDWWSCHSSDLTQVLTSFAGETVMFLDPSPGESPCVAPRGWTSPNCVGFSFANTPCSSSSIWKYIMGRFLPEILHKSRPRIWFFEATCGQNGNLALPNNTQHNTQDLQLSSISTLRSQVREKAWLKICFATLGSCFPKLSLFPEKKGHFYKNMFVCHTKIQSAHVTSPCKVCIPYWK